MSITVNGREQFVCDFRPADLDVRPVTRRTWHVTGRAVPGLVLLFLTAGGLFLRVGASTGGFPYLALLPAAALAYLGVWLVSRGLVKLELTLEQEHVTLRTEPFSGRPVYWREPLAKFTMVVFGRLGGKKNNIPYTVVKLYHPDPDKSIVWLCSFSGRPDESRSEWEHCARALNIPVSESAIGEPGLVVRKPAELDTTFAELARQYVDDTDAEPKSAAPKGVELVEEGEVKTFWIAARIRNPQASSWPTRWTFGLIAGGILLLVLVFAEHFLMSLTALFVVLPSVAALLWMLRAGYVRYFMPRDHVLRLERDMVRIDRIHPATRALSEVATLRVDVIEDVRLHGRGPGTGPVRWYISFVCDAGTVELPCPSEYAADWVYRHLLAFFAKPETSRRRRSRS